MSQQTFLFSQSETEKLAGRQKFVELIKMGSFFVHFLLRIGQN
jgi:hypothetical protein